MEQVQRRAALNHSICEALKVVVQRAASRSCRRRAARCTCTGLPGVRSREPDQAEAVVLADAVVVRRVAEGQRQQPCFFRLDSWMRAKLRAMTAAPPSSRGDSAACSRLLPSP